MMNRSRGDEPRETLYLVSACFTGRKCRWDGGTNTVPEIARLVEEGRAVPVCPEVMGGLPTPRLPSERSGDRVVNRAGEDVTAAFRRGAEEALHICRECGCTRAVLKARSPSCGCRRIYSGRFDGTLTEGNGVLADLLLQEGIPVMTEEDFLAGPARGEGDAEIGEKT